VQGPDFFGRSDDVDRLWKAVAGGNVLLVSPRRVGKTSLMHNLVDEPRKGWAPIFANLEGKTSAAAVVEEVLAALQRRDDVGKRAVDALSEAIGRIKGIGALGLNLQLDSAAKDHWAVVSREFEKAIAASASPERKLLLVVDEFPIVIDDLFSESATQAEARKLLRLFRKLRTDKPLLDRFRMLVGGSIGLKSVLRRYKATADANDLNAFRLGPWSNVTANDFIDRIGEKHSFAFSPAVRTQIFEGVGETPMPFHLQMMLDRLLGLNIKSADLTSAHVGKARRYVLDNVSLDHYRERLPKVLDPDAEAAAEAILAKLATDGPLVRKALSECSSVKGAVKDALRVLEEDGYVSVSDDDPPIFAFANPMLRDFWKKHYTDD